MGQQLGVDFAIDALGILVDQGHLVDAVVIPFVMGSHLIDPFGSASVCVTRPNGHRPLVVAWTLHRVPSGRVARTVVNQVQFRIIAIPAPSGAAADLPLVALPSLQGRILANRSHFAVGPSGGLFGIDLHLGIRTGTVSFPSQGAVFGVISRQESTDTIFAAGDAGDDLVFDNNRRIGVGFAFLGITIFDFPNQFASLCIQGNQSRIALGQEDFAIPICQAAVDHVATHYTNDLRLVGACVSGILVLPHHALGVLVQSVNFVGVASVDVDQSTDD